MMRTLSMILFLFLFLRQDYSLLFAQNSLSTSTSDIEYLQNEIQDKPKNLKLRIQLAQEYKKINNPSKVIETLKPFTAELNKSGLLLIGEAYGALKDYESQKQIYTFLVEKKNEDPQALVLLGKALFASGDKGEQSSEHFRKALRINRKYAPAYEALLAVHRSNEKDESRSYYEQIQIYIDMKKYLGPKPEYLNEICRLYHAQGYVEETIKNCRLAMKKSPKHAENLVYIGGAYMFSEQTAKAKKTLLKAAKKFPQSELAQDAIGKIYISEKNYIGAEPYYKNCIQHHPQAIACTLGFAITNFGLKKYAIAYEAFMKSCALNRSLTNHEFNTAATSLSLSNESDALKWQAKYYSGSENCGINNQK